MIFLEFIIFLFLFDLVNERQYIMTNIILNRKKFLNIYYNKKLYSL